MYFMPTCVLNGRGISGKPKFANIFFFNLKTGGCHVKKISVVKSSCIKAKGLGGIRPPLPLNFSKLTGMVLL